MLRDTSSKVENGMPYKFTHIAQMTLVLWVIYVLITGNFEIRNLVVGLLIGLIISLLVRPQQLAIRWRNLPVGLWSIFRYLLHLVWDLFISSLQVAGIILKPELPINPGIVEIDASCQSELSAALNAHALTLTPGELVVEMDDEGRLFAHALDTQKTMQVAKQVQDLRRDLLSKIFE